MTSSANQVIFRPTLNDDTLKNLILLIAVLVAPVVDRAQSGFITVTNTAVSSITIGDYNPSILTNVSWFPSNETPEIFMTISTNVTTKWTTVEEINDYAPTFTISRFDLFKQVGQTSTNRVLTITHEGATNLVVLKVLGKQEWPMEKRVLTVPARYRPFQ